MSTQRFEFAWADRWRRPLRLVGIRPETSFVDIGTDGLHVRFGLCHLDTPLSNITGVETSGDYKWYRAIGPHISLKDRGVSFGTNLESGVCIRFATPVRALPLLPITHPGCTLTTEDVPRFVDTLNSLL